MTKSLADIMAFLKAEVKYSVVSYFAPLLAVARALSAIMHAHPSGTRSIQAPRKQMDLVQRNAG